LLLTCCSLAGLCYGLGSLPDARQEGLLHQFNSYKDVALFHFRVPRQVVRATWDFAGFQDRSDCQSRTAQIWIQHGSYPLFQTQSSEKWSGTYTSKNGSSSGKADDDSGGGYSVYPVRTELARFTVDTEFRPVNSKVFYVYNPLPGSWFVAAYLDPFVETLGVRAKCRYSLGSVALWTPAHDAVDLILPNRQPPQTFRSKSKFSYLKFFVPDDVDSFRLKLDGCVVLLSHPRTGLNNDTNCIEYVGYRAKALPVHDPTVVNDAAASDRRSQIGAGNASVVFEEQRPYKNEYYYLLVVSEGQVSYRVKVEFEGCGQTGLYGPGQRDWYLSERGLMKDTGDAAGAGSGGRRAKEPKSGFQLFARKSEDLASLRLNADDFKEDFSLIQSDEISSNNSTVNNSCISTFDFNQITDVDAFAAGYVLQGKSWYTEWVTVTEKSPVFTRFDVHDFVDIGGHLTIKIGFDSNGFVPEKLRTQIEGGSHRHGANETADSRHQQQLVYGCLSLGRQPRVTANASMICDDRESSIKLLNKVGASPVTKVIPFPEPGKWYLGFQIVCYREEVEVEESSANNATANTTTTRKVYGPCPTPEMKTTMISINIVLEGCPGQTEKRECSGHGLCASVHKGHHRLSTCICSQGYQGLYCQEEVPAQRTALLVGTLLLTLSNLAFAPGVVLALKYGLYGEGLVYFAAMAFSTLYHVCDQVTVVFADSPVSLQAICVPLYMEREVLQFGDFYAATLSMWVTLVALLRGLEPSLKLCFDLFGSLLVAVLVQYNRTGVEVFAVPVCIGVFLLVTTYLVRSRRRGRLYRPNRKFVVRVGVAILLSVTALSMIGFVASSQNYPYVHSAWHILLAVSLALLVPQCSRRRSRKKAESNANGANDATTKSASVTTSSDTNDDDDDASLKSVTVDKNDANHAPAAAAASSTTTAEDDFDEEDTALSNSLTSTLSVRLSSLQTDPSV